MLKKIIAVLLAALCIAGLAACAKKTNSVISDDPVLITGKDKDAVKVTKAQNAGESKGDNRDNTEMGKEEYLGYSESTVMMAFGGAVEYSVTIKDMVEMGMIDAGDKDDEAQFTGPTAEKVFEEVGISGNLELIFKLRDGEQKVKVEEIDLQNSVFAVKKGGEVLGQASRTKVIFVCVRTDGSVEYIEIPYPITVTK